jgi:hypothetical protein
MSYLNWRLALLTMTCTHGTRKLYECFWGQELAEVRLGEELNIKLGESVALTVEGRHRRRLVVTVMHGSFRTVGTMSSLFLSCTYYYHKITNSRLNSRNVQCGEVCSGTL